ncbi:hypothetical protein BD560DRAFT_401550, partial [Blakeslea trispora]
VVPVIVLAVVVLVIPVIVLAVVVLMVPVIILAVVVLVIPVIVLVSTFIASLGMMHLVLFVGVLVSMVFVVLAVVLLLIVHIMFIFITSLVIVVLAIPTILAVVPTILAMVPAVIVIRAAPIMRVRIAVIMRLVAGYTTVFLKTAFVSFIRHAFMEVIPDPRARLVACVFVASVYTAPLIIMAVLTGVLRVASQDSASSS